MNRIDVIAQTIGIVAMVFNVLSYQCKKNRNLILVQGMGGVLFCINYLMLGSLPSAGINIISVIASALAIGRKTHNHIVFGIICLCFLGMSVVTYESLWTIVLMMAQLAMTYGFWYQSGEIIRKIRIFFTSPVWLINNIFVAFTIGGIACEVFSIASAVISFIRFSKQGFEKD